MTKAQYELEIEELRRRVRDLEQQIKNDASEALSAMNDFQREINRLKAENAQLRSGR